MSWQTILVGWLVLIQYQHAEYNEVGRQCPKASWALGGLLPVSYSSGAADSVESHSKGCAELLVLSTTTFSCANHGTLNSRKMS